MFIPKVLKNYWKKNFFSIFWDLKNYVCFGFRVFEQTKRKHAEKNIKCYFINFLQPKIIV